MAKLFRKLFPVFFLVIGMPFLLLSQNHIDTVKNNSISFTYGLPLWSTKNFSEISPYNYGRILMIKYQRILSRPGNFLVKSEFGLGTVRDACEFYICPVVDLSLTTEYGIKRHFILFGLGTSFNLPEGRSGISGYYKFGYSYFFSKRAFVSIYVEQVLWILADKSLLSPTDECEECYETIYNIWTWDFEDNVFKVNLGLGFKF